MVKEITVEEEIAWAGDPRKGKHHDGVPAMLVF